MFVEKLTDKNLKDFAEKFNCSLTTILKYNNDDMIIYLKLFNGSYGPQPEMTLSDFDCRLNDYYSFANEKIKTDWIKFLYEKFGEEYKTKLIDFTTNQIEELSK